MKRFTMCCLLAMIIGAEAEAETAPQPLAFRTVMQALGGNMEQIAGAIAREDWAAVEQTTPLIAKHSEWPADEHERIVRFLGRDIERFQQHDHATHKAAHALEHAAVERNAQAVIDAFRDVQRGCQGCHHDFRQSFVEHFYGKR